MPNNRATAQINRESIMGNAENTETATHKKEAMPFKAIKTDKEIYDDMRNQVMSMWNDMLDKLKPDQKYKAHTKVHYMFPKLKDLGLETWEQLNAEYLLIAEKKSNLSANDRRLVSRVVFEVHGYALQPSNNQHFVDAQEKLRLEMEANADKPDIGVGETKPKAPRKPRATKSSPNTKAAGATETKPKAPRKPRATKAKKSDK